MSFKPWKQPLLTAIALMAGTTAAIAQNVQSAQRAIELGRYNEARAQLRTNSSPEAQYELGRLYQKRDMPDSAAFYFDKAVSQTPMGQVAAGRALLAKGQTGPAEAQFDAAAKATKNKDSRILTLIAQAYAESDVKDTGKALNYVNLAQTANKGKDEPSLMVARGDIYLHNDNGGGPAMDSYDRATMANPSYAQAYYKKGVLSVRSRNFPDAQTNLKKAIELDPSYAPAYRELADMYYYANQPKLAVDNIKKYVGLAEPSPTTNAQYAAFLYLSKEYPDALTEVNKVLAVDPNNLTMNRLKAYLSYETKDYAGAAAAMDNYMRIAPESKLIPEDYVYKGRILAAAGRGDEGIAVLEKFIQTNPDKACDLQNDLATAYSAKKDYAGAIRAYKKKLMPPCNGDLADQFRLAAAYNSNKQYPQADSTFNIILTAKPTYSPGYLARARTNMSMDPEGKKGLAKPYYDKYIELSQAPEADASKFREGLVESYGYLGVYNFQAGKKPEAIQNFEKVLELDPGNQGAINNIKILKAPTKTTTTKKTTTTTKKK